MSEVVHDTTMPVARVDAEAKARHRPAPRAADVATAGRFKRSFAPVDAAPVATVQQRVVAIDVLRGFTMLWIIGGDGLAWSLQQMTADQGGFLAAAGAALGDQFSHAPWEGFSFYELIFPLFIFTTGAAIVLSLGRLVEREGKARAHLRVVRRALLLFALGVIFYGGLSREWPEVRLAGVLQRIALCYLFASLLFLNLSVRGLVIAFVTLLVGYWALLTFVPVPGTGVASYAERANLANWIDLHFLPGEKWNVDWDPEGLLSTLPAIGTCLIGVFAGLLLTNPRVSPQRKSWWLVGSGLAALAAGHLWGLQFPIVKNIWTSSYVLVAGGYSLVMLGVMHHLIDVRGMKAWAAAFVWIGANAITLYMLNGLFGFERVAVRLVGGDIANLLDALLAPGTGRLVAHVLGLVLAIALARYLYQRKIFLRV